MGTHKALVTGASNGIGAVYADRLARRGYDLVLVARNRDRLDALAERLRRETGVSVEVLVADLAVASDLGRVEQRLRDDAAIDLLVNNAGIAGKGPFASASMDQHQAIIDLNVVSITRLAAAAAAGFVARGRGTLVNLSSVTALMAESFEPVYLASKAYVLAFSQALHTELGKHGVHVQVVLPGVVRTDIWSHETLETLPEAMIMEAGEMVDAALAGLDLGEAVTIPSLPDAAQWHEYTRVRLGLGPNLSRKHAAPRYQGAG